MDIGEISDGFRLVIQGKLAEASVGYACHS